MKIKAKTTTLWLILFLLIFICGFFTSCSNAKSEKQEMMYTKTEFHPLEKISIETKTVDNKQYQILTISYVDTHLKWIEKSILVDFDSDSCLWNSEDGINFINNNLTYDRILDNGLTLTNEAKEKSSIEVIKTFYTDISELASLEVKLDLTKEDYERLFS